MGLVDLPVEIFESIIDLAIPEFWNDSVDGFAVSHAYFLTD
jgi:hypothetical protein